MAWHRLKILLLSAIIFYSTLTHIHASYAQSTLTLSLSHLQHQITLVVETAYSSQQRQRGLSHREHLAVNKGMLFFFKQSDYHCFWMKDTYVPLAAAFIDHNNKVIKTALMSPHSLQRHCANQPVKRVLEAHPQLLDNVLKIGSTVKIIQSDSIIE